MTVRTAAFPVIDGGKTPGGRGLDNPTRPPDPPDMEQRVAILEAGMGEIKGTLGRMEVALTEIRGTLARVDDRLTRVEGTVGRMDDRLRNVEIDVVRMDGRNTSLEGRFDGRLSGLEGQLRQIPNVWQTITIMVALMGGLFTILKLFGPTH